MEEITEKKLTENLKKLNGLSAYELHVRVEDMAKNDQKYKGVPTPIYKFFKTDATKVENDKDFKQLKEISEWAFDKDVDLEAGMKKLRELEIQLGLPKRDEKRWSKIYNWLKIEKNIKDLQKQQEALS